MREFPTPQEILNVFEREPGKTYRLRELVVELGLRSSQARELKSVLKDLARQRHVVCLKKSHFALAGKVAQGAPQSIDRSPTRQRQTPTGGPLSPPRNCLRQPLRFSARSQIINTTVT